MRAFPDRIFVIKCMEEKQVTPGEQAGLLWTWWQDDPLPILSPLLDFAVEEASNQPLLASLMGIAPATIAERFQTGHRPYLARLGTIPAAYGWSASGQAAFGGGLVTFQLPAKNRYLYDFVTLPTWRGLGIYPRLLQAILRKESSTNERFWIIHQASNTASERGISKAGFRVASQVHFLSSGGLGLIALSGEGTRANAGAAVLGLPLIEEVSQQH